MSILGATLSTAKRWWQSSLARSRGHLLPRNRIPHANQYPKIPWRREQYKGCQWRIAKKHLGRALLADVIHSVVQFTLFFINPSGSHSFFVNPLFSSCFFFLFLPNQPSSPQLCGGHRRLRPPLSSALSGEPLSSVHSRVHQFNLRTCQVT